MSAACGRGGRHRPSTHLRARGGLRGVRHGAQRPGQSLVRRPSLRGPARPAPHSRRPERADRLRAGRASRRRHGDRVGLRATRAARTAEPLLEALRAAYIAAPASHRSAAASTRWPPPACSTGGRPPPTGCSPTISPRRFPAVKLDPDVLYVDDGDILTSAGTGAGIDLCLHLLELDHGAAVANAVPTHGRAAPSRRRPGAVRADRRDLTSQPCSALSRLGTSAPPPPADRGRPRAPGQLGQRTFVRRFADATGTSPLRWLTSERIRLAQQLLETTDEPIERIARHRLRHATQPAPAFRSRHQHLAAGLSTGLPSPRERVSMIGGP